MIKEAISPSELSICLDSHIHRTLMKNVFPRAVGGFWFENIAYELKPKLTYQIFCCSL